MSFPPRYQLPSFHPYKRGGSPDLDVTATTADFRAIATAIHSELFAEHPDTEIFTNVVKLLLAKIYDERVRKPGETYIFQVLQNNGREEAAASLFERVAALYSTAYTALIDQTAADVLDSKVFAPERVKSVVKGLQGVAITRGAALHGDVIGTFFEEILRAGFKQDKGMYFTHANLVWFMLEALDLTGLTQASWRKSTHPNSRMPYVIDPSCGSGTFLLRSMQMMTAAIRDHREELVQTQDDESYFGSLLPNNNPNLWAKDFIFGADPKFVMAITAKVNMVLHGDGSAHIYKWDGLKPLAAGPDRRLQPLPDASRSIPTAQYRHDVSEQFDVVATNPPFGITLDPETRRTVGSNFSLGDRAPSESLFLERYAQLLRPNGRLAVVVPESLLNASDYRASRVLLYRFFWVRAVVSIPRNLFVETPTLVSLLFAQRKTADEIAKWDAEWVASCGAFDTALTAARQQMATASASADSTPALISKAFNDALGDLLGPDAYVRTRGKNGAVVFARLPSSVTTADEAVAHYEAFLRVAQRSNLRDQTAFKLVSSQSDYSRPVYAVDEVGYKLSKRGERIRPNQLMVFKDDSGDVITNVHTAKEMPTPSVDTDNPTTVLDFLRRDIKWR